MKKYILGSLLVLVSCTSVEKVAEKEISDNETKDLGKTEQLAQIFENSDTFRKTITGFMLFDPEGDSTIYAENENKYMIPASNTKLFTYYAGLNVLGDRIPALKYTIKGDSLIFWGTGDPSFLHPDFGTDDVYDLLSTFDGNLYFSDSNFNDENLGPGWSWADYNSYYSAEKSPFPIYGNVARVTIEHIEEYHLAKENGEYLINPKIFNKYIDEGVLSDNGRFVLERDRVGNEFEYAFTSDTSRYETDKPFHYSPQLIVELLSDTLNKSVEYLPEEKLTSNHEMIYSMDSDSLYKKMLLPSDNLLAEQIMLMISGVVGDELNSSAGIRYVKDNFLSDLPDEANWRDGSGLSRYNLFTPRSMVTLLEKLDEKVEENQLLDALPQGGKQGTIRRLYANKDGGEPYVFAKTGTLSNNHCLSGYVITRSGKKLIFSFMNNNYVISTSEVQAQMDEILWFVRENW
ncbi:MAG: D-alanyl-D-alanine carboxypeptidase [Balneola sp.]|nr:D-alanyl-D-alanine carboxypeptidase [Balneola sp.]MBO6650068.1 D-alanyl-D-alanine carboxypeptidase [Balneola sp.]MBO6711582.1 D-alanyl-D-alanine carboxypeptidase [Balneola sp.]MBO6799778.1 D-alanyl-D-alanine carboxypeptidase [Balneola sp.]MBO6870781.1 D-alanyl-D-alanine carboxypeptidase [Balneola sp.]